MERDSHFFVDSFKTIKYCNTEIVELTGSAFQLPYETEPTKGEHDYNTCENCKKSFKIIFDLITVRFAKFPLCCAGHSNLAKAKWFNKDEFGDIPTMVANKVIFTKQHIINNIDSENWYDKITNYIKHTIESFGQMPSGFGEAVFLSDFLQHVAESIKANKGIQSDKQARILDYIKFKQRPNSKKPNRVDIEILLKTYQKWLDTFPFELSFFKEMKQDFVRRLPIMQGKLDYNPYSRRVYGQMQTQSGLIKILSKNTKKLLHKIDTNKLYIKASDPEKTKLEMEIIMESHRVKQSKLVGDFSKGETEYVKIVDVWLSNEQTFFEKIRPTIERLVEQSNIRENLTKTEGLKIEFKKYGFFSLKSLTEFSEIEINNLIKEISIKELPYQIAMVDFLGFINHLENEHCKTKNHLYKLLAKVLTTVDRAVKGNILVLNPKSEENKERYTAHLHKEQVKKDYEKLK